MRESELTTAQRTLLREANLQPLEKVRVPPPPRSVIRLRAKAKVQKFVAKWKKEKAHG